MALLDVTNLCKLLVTAAVFSSSMSFAQIDSGNATGTKKIKFEVASVTQVEPGKPAEAGNTFVPTPDGYRSSLTVGQMVLLAYGPSDPLTWDKVPLINWPSWIGGGDDWYVVNARVSDADREIWRNQSNKHELLRSAMQALLKDRCKLEIHEKPAQIEAYTLVVQKKGPKLKPASPQGYPRPEHVYKLPSGAFALFESKPGQPSRLHFYGATMDDLVQFMTRSSSGRPVHDATGLTGHYEFTLQASANPSRDEHETIYTWQLGPIGLDVKLIKEMGYGLVIDHIERPSLN